MSGSTTNPNSSFNSDSFASQRNNRDWERSNHNQERRDLKQEYQDILNQVREQELRGQEERELNA